MAMRDEVRKDMSLSSHALATLVIPILRDHCPEFKRSDFRIIEGKEDSVGHDLDILAGIDAYQRWLSAMRGIASRVQFGRDFQTFTIRIARPSGVTTEYEKRLKAIKHRDEGYLYPYWTVQAYIASSGERLLSVGLAKTAELYLYIEAQEEKGQRLPRNRAGNGGEQFLYVPWSQYRQSSNFFFTWPASTTNQLEHTFKRMKEQQKPSEEVFSISDYDELFALENGIAEADRIWQEREGQ